MDITSGYLERLLRYLREEKFIDFHIPCSDAFYVSAHIESKFGIKIDPGRMEKILQEEGLLSKGNE